MILAASKGQAASVATQMAGSSSQGRVAVDMGPFGPFRCPLYRYPSRGANQLVCHVNLPSRDHRPDHWALRGAALLCHTDF